MVATYPTGTAPVRKGVLCSRDDLFEVICDVSTAETAWVVPAGTAWDTEEEELDDVVKMLNHYRELHYELHDDMYDLVLLMQANKRIEHYTEYKYHASNVPKQVKPHRKLMSPRAGYRGVKLLKRR